MTQARDLADGKFDTDTLVVDAANNRVGIGETSPTYDLSVTNTDGEWLYLKRTSGAELKINASASAGFIGTTTNYPIALQVNSSEIARLTSNGLTFNGDTAAANAIDDYEEGTWTPVVDHTSSTNSTFGSATGNYTKIGNTVTAQFRLDGGNTGTAGSFLKIGGLPFTVNQGQSNQSIGIWGSNPSSQVGNIHGFNPPRLYKGGTDITTQMTFVTGMLVYKI